MTRTTTASPNPRRTLRFIAIALAVLSLALPCPAQDLARRLILKDGSYQLVTQYEVKGDRVRYKSAERNEWEELPSSLVDWPATEKYGKDRTTSAIPEAAALDKEKDKDKETEAQASQLPQVAPGLRLPEDSGIFLLDNFQGQPELVEMQQTEGDLNRSAKANIFRGIPMAGAKPTVELEGEHASLHVHVAVPSIYINVDEGDPRLPPKGETASPQLSQPSLDAPRTQQPAQAIVPFDRFRIVRAKVKGGKRSVNALKGNAPGKVSQDQDFVNTTLDRMSGGWFKLTPTHDLEPGEYALVEIQGNEGMNLYLWDFGVNPNAPANANPWKPEVKDKDKDAAEPQKPKENL
jgi:hypothetical protein